MADFGCGHTFDGIGSANNALTMQGNLAYCAPEVTEGKLKNLKINYSRKSDIWSLAVVAYECLTGKFPGRDFCAMFKKYYRSVIYFSSWERKVMKECKS